MTHVAINAGWEKEGNKERVGMMTIWATFSYNFCLQVLLESILT